MHETYILVFSSISLYLFNWDSIRFHVVYELHYDSGWPRWMDPVRTLCESGGNH